MTSYWFRNGTVHTMKPRDPWASSVVVHDDAIVFVGGQDDARPHVR